MDESHSDTDNTDIEKADHLRDAAPSNPESDNSSQQYDALNWLRSNYLICAVAWILLTGLTCFVYISSTYQTDRLYYVLWFLFVVFLTPVFLALVVIPDIRKTTKRWILTFQIITLMIVGFFYFLNLFIFMEYFLLPCTISPQHQIPSNSSKAVQEWASNLVDSKSYLNFVEMGDVWYMIGMPGGVVMAIDRKNSSLSPFVLTVDGKVVANVKYIDRLNTSLIVSNEILHSFEIDNSSWSSSPFGRLIPVLSVSLFNSTRSIRSAPQNVMVIDGLIYFTISEADPSTTVYVSNGSVAGTMKAFKYFDLPNVCAGDLYDIFVMMFGWVVLTLLIALSVVFCIFALYPSDISPHHIISFSFLGLFCFQFIVVTSFGADISAFLFFSAGMIIIVIMDVLLVMKALKVSWEILTHSWGHLVVPLSYSLIAVISVRTIDDDLFPFAIALIGTGVFEMVAVHSLIWKVCGCFMLSCGIYVFLCLYFSSGFYLYFTTAIICSSITLFYFSLTFHSSMADFVEFNMLD